MIKDLALRSRHAQEERERSMHGVAGRTSHLHRAHVHSSHVHSSHHGHSTHVHSSHHLHSTHGVTSVTSPQRRCVGRWGRGSGRRAFGRGRRRARTENEENGNGERFRDHRGGAPGEGGGVVSGAPSSRSGDLVGDTSVRSSATQTRAWRRAYARSGADVKNTQIQIAGRERSVGGTVQKQAHATKGRNAEDGSGSDAFFALSAKSAYGDPSPSSWGSPRHLAAFSCALPASLCAFLAVLVRVLVTLGRASIAGLRAEKAKLLRETASSSHQQGSQPADVGAVAVELDAVDHLLYRLLFQAGGRTLFTGDGTFLTRFDARRQLGYLHCVSGSGSPALVHAPCRAERLACVLQRHGAYTSRITYPWPHVARRDRRTLLATEAERVG